MRKEYQSPKQVIQSYLEERAKSDPLFATSYAKPNKNIDECYDYIIGEAKKRGGSVVCMSDDEVFKVSKQPATKAVVSNRPEKKKKLIPSIEKTQPEQIANNKRKGKKKEIPTGQFLLFEDL